MKKIFKRHIMHLGVIFSPFVVSCTDFLTETDPSSFALDNYYSTAAHAESAITAVYQSLYPIHDDLSWLMLEFQTGITDTYFAGSGGWANNQPVKSLTNNSDHPSLATYWNSHYKGIANANVAIQKVPSITMDAQLKSKYLGEAHFLRAYFYFNLVRIFGNIPLITEPVDLSSSDLFPEQVTARQVFDLIVADLLQAEKSGLPMSDNTGRVSMGAVKSMLSTVYLTMAGYPLNLGSTYYELARDKAAEVIESNVFRLFDNYSDLHNKATDNRGEHIFMVQYHESEKNSNNIQSAIIPFRGGISLLSAEEGLFFALRRFVESFEIGDKRAMEGQFFFSKFTSESDRNKEIDLGDYYLYKFIDLKTHLETARSGLNWQVIRYTDVLFNYAEASNEISGPTTQSLDIVNAVRKRANLAGLSIGIGKEEFRQAVWRERWYEHCYEGKIWYDMVRVRKGFNLVSRQFEDYVGHKFSYGPVLSERELLFPIPTSEIRNNRKLTQNKGY